MLIYFALNVQKSGVRCLCESVGDAVRCNHCSGPGWSYPHTDEFGKNGAAAELDLKANVKQLIRRCVASALFYFFCFHLNHFSVCNILLFSVFSFFSFYHLHLHSLPFFVDLALPRLAQFCLTYFFSILTICLSCTNSSAPLSSLCFSTNLFLSLWWTLLDFSSTHLHLPNSYD